jgi:hypothetical protein
MVTYFSKKKNSPVIHPLITCGSVKSLPDTPPPTLHMLTEMLKAAVLPCVDFAVPMVVNSL